MQSKTPLVSLMVVLTGLIPLGAFAQTAEKPVLGVLDFNTEGFSPAEVAKIKVLSEQLMVEFSNTGKYQVIERAKRDEILKQNSLPTSTPVSYERLLENGSVQFYNDDLTKAGRILAASKMVGGALTKFEKEWFVEIRILDVSTGFSDRRVTWFSKGKLEGLLFVIPKIVESLTKSPEPKKITAYSGPLRSTAAWEKYAQITTYALVGSTALVWGMSEYDYRRYRRATVDGDIISWKNKARGINSFVPAITGLMVARAGSWFYYHQRKKQYQRLDSLARDFFSPDALPPTFKVSDMHNITFSLFDIAILSGSMAVLLNTEANNSYRDYQRATVDSIIQRNKRSIKDEDAVTVACIAASLIATGAWIYCDRKENVFLQRAESANKTSSGFRSLQLGLVPDPRGRGGAHPGLVYTWRF